MIIHECKNCGRMRLKRSLSMEAVFWTCRCGQRNNKITSERLMNLAQIQSMAEKALEEDRAGETRPISELWDDLDAE